MSHKHLFARALDLAPGRLHFAAHSHHLWPDVSHDAQNRAWDDAMRHADRKWELILGEVEPEARSHIARELALPSSDSLVFASSTHDLLLRLVSGIEVSEIERRPVRILSTDGEFHSFRRQAERWQEAGQVVVETIAVAPFDTFADRFVAAAKKGGHDLILVSQVFFRTGGIFDRLEDLADLADPAGPWVVVDGYHGFMALPTDLSTVADRVFYMGGGYKYAMSGEGACFLHAPPGFCPRPVITGWFAEFGDLEGPPGGVGYRTDGGRLLGATFDPSALYRFNAVRRMLDDEGLTTADIARHARGLRTRFTAALAAGQCGTLGNAEVLNPVHGDEACARFLALRHPEAATWTQGLQAQNIVTDVRDDVIRFGFSLYQDEADVDALIGACAGLD